MATAKPATGLPELADSELEVLKVLWSERRLAAREVHERLAERHGWASSTTRTILERMVGKGLLTKGAFHGLYLYQAAISRPQGLARRVRDFARRVVETDWAPVVSLFAEAQALSPAEIEELSRLLAASDAEERQ